MKKWTKFLSIFTVCLLSLVLLTSCQNKKNSNKTCSVETEGVLEIIHGEDEKYQIKVGENVILFDLDKDVLGIYKDDKLYLNEAHIPVGNDYEVIYKTTEMPTINNKGIFGDYFAGWYQTDEFRNAAGNLNNEVKLSDRIITLEVAELDSDHILHAYFISFSDAIIVTVICMIIVFLMLILIMGLVMLLKFVAPKETTKSNEQKNNVENRKEVKKLKLEDIKDEDMMVAALVATIDYHNETNEDVRVVSIKQIG